MLGDRDIIPAYSPIETVQLVLMQGNAPSSINHLFM